MAKMRVNELAKKLGVSNKELIAFLNENNIASVKSHANNISDDEANAAINLYNKNRAGATDVKSEKQEKAVSKVEASDKTIENKESRKEAEHRPEHKAGQEKKDGALSNHSPKKKIVMKINPQNISNKNHLAKMTKKEHSHENTKKGNSENERIRQEILERQKKIEEYRKQQEKQEREHQERIAAKRQQLLNETETLNNKVVVEPKIIEKAKPELSIKQEAANDSSKNIPEKAGDNNVGESGDKDKAVAVSNSTVKQSQAIGASNTQSMEQRKEFKHQTGKPNKAQQRDNKGNFQHDNRGTNPDGRSGRRDGKAGEGKFVKKPFNKGEGNRREGGFGNSDSRQDNREKKPFRAKDGQQRAGFSDRRFDKDKDDQDGKNSRRERPRNEKGHNSSIVAPIDDRNKKAKEKVRESKESKNKDKRKDRMEKFERTFSLERTSKKTHKQALKSKQNMQLQAELNKEQEKVSLIVIPDIISIKELAEKMKIGSAVLIKELFLKGKVVTLNQEIDFETAEEIAMEHDILCELEEKVDVIEEMLKEDEDSEENMVKRPPVVCVMGHVDHGKTSLLDAIRNTHVIDKEAGGITQHIGAYMVKVHDQKITFLDTPGHEAFTAMRMRGASSTDIAILVVAADDGVMPQTIEAINHAKAAGIEIIVAINKVDKPSANIDRVKQELSDQGLIPEDWGGSHIFVPVSAKTGAGIDELLEMIILTADVAELKANPNRRARGLVLEAKLDKGRGSVANILVQKGTLRVGDFISAGHCSGKVRAMMDDKGRKIKEAGISTPVEILGLNDVPNAGEILVAHDTDKDAKSFAATFVSEGRERLLEETKAKMSLDDLFAKIKEDNLKEFSLVVKADVQGSAEAIKQSLEKLSNEEVVIKIIHSGVGAINESDVILASASNAIIIGFNVRPDAQAKNVADAQGVDIRLYGVIYQAIEDVEAAMKGMLDPIYEEQVIGHAEIRQIFKASGIGNIAGSYVLDGFFERNCKVRISRGEEQIFEGDLASLKRFKDDVKEVKAGFECGLVFDGFNEIEELDRVEAYKIVEVKR